MPTFDPNSAGTLIILMFNFLSSAAPSPSSALHSLSLYGRDDFHSVTLIVRYFVTSDGQLASASRRIQVYQL